MTVCCFILGLLECALLWFLGQAGQKLNRQAEQERAGLRIPPPGGWPSCALIIPVGGVQTQTGAALRSLLEQDYPDYQVYFVTAREDEAAVPLLRALCVEYGAYHVTAGVATESGQKNRNLLAGVAAAGQGFAIYAFCDSTHMAPTDFLRALVRPIAEGKAEFATGYHLVFPADQGIITLSYAMCALFMRFLQGLSGLTQLWGGAMAIQKTAFFRLRVGALWATNVVDDCSLSAWLHKNGIPVRLCSAALLETVAKRQSFSLWRAWLDRQILFLKFCMPGQWLLLCAVSLFLLIPPLWALWAFGSGLAGSGTGTAPFLALCWLCLCGWILGDWRAFFARPIDISRWIVAFFCSCAMFFAACAATLFKRRIVWQKIKYVVGKNGAVLKIQP